MQIDSASAALLGACIGGTITLLGNIITAYFTSIREHTSFKRSTSLQHIDRVRDAYQHALNVLVNMGDGATPERATFGNLFAQVALLGSPEVNSLVQTYINQPHPKGAPDLPQITQAMKLHLLDLESSL